jgi:putative Holliday junction resolvase
MREGMQKPPGSPDRDSSSRDIHSRGIDAAAKHGTTDIIVLAFDFGTRRIGVALGNGITRGAHALKVVSARPAAAMWRELAGLVDHWQPHQIVVGIARHPDGAAHEMTERCERFARQLEGRFHLPVARVDERYSSAVLPAGSDSDDHAAAVILQQWFDGAAPASPAAAPRAPAPC